VGIDSVLPPEASEVLLAEEQIRARVHELGAQISRDYEGEDLMLIGILKGSFIFLADLVRSISIPLSVGFVTVSSYGASTQSSGDVRIVGDLPGSGNSRHNDTESVEGRHVLLVEDIVDTGCTLRMSRLEEILIKKGAASVKICALLDKPERRRVEIAAQYTGFRIPDKFVVGYGLDFRGLYRNLPCICVLKEHGPGTAEKITL
jgi:hypoxanthine phosphoribosyltransferase